MTGPQVALSDKQQLLHNARIDTLENEIVHKAKVLTAQVVKNRELSPILDGYLTHIRNRKETAAAIVQHMHSLLISLNTITVPRDVAGAGTGGKVQSDQTAIFTELARWKKVLSDLSEF
jgi:hypothetical protein